MKVVIAPDSFKESMTALEAAQAIAAGVYRVLPDAECDLVPMADGGEGTVQALIDALGGESVTAEVHDAIGRLTTASYGYVAATKLAVIEMAAASGLELIAPSDRDVLRASTFGTGEIIRNALDRGARRFIIGIGGSATNDAGTGMAQALGVHFLNARGADLPPGGGALADLATIDVTGLDQRLADSSFEIACDVDNPLLGVRGASAIFGPQKGATPELVPVLDAALRRWADVVEPAISRPIRELAGAGAAGGLGAGLAAFIPNVTLRRGVDIVIDAVNLTEHVRDATLVFTGEGGIDSQTLHGKTPWGVLQVAKSAGVPVVMFGGRIGSDASVLIEAGVTAIVPIVRSIQTLSEALATGSDNLTEAAELTTRLLLLELNRG